MKKLIPDDKTISDFRKNNVECIKQVFKQFVCFLENIDLVEGKLVSTDGSKIKAWNANDRNFTRQDCPEAAVHRKEDREVSQRD
jgi:transposase